MDWRKSKYAPIRLPQKGHSTLAGTALGAVVAMWSAQLLSRWLYEVNPTDAISLVAAELILIGVSLAACTVPGVRATRADPVEVLRAT